MANDNASSITVTMGNANTVGHIGDIVYQTPPPPPNAIYHNDIVVGVFEGQPVRNNQEYTFPHIVLDGQHSLGEQFTIQGVQLALTKCDVSRFISLPGFGARTTYENAVCKIVD